MGFLTPLLLALAAAVAVPIVLHLFQRHQGPRMIFPALRYLRRAERENARRIKLRQILLLALRVAALVFLALAAARPFVRAGGLGHEPTAAAIVLDNSLSSGLVLADHRVLDALKQRALEMLAQAAPDDRFWVIRAGSPGEPALPGDAAAAADRVRGTDVSAGAADLRAAIGRARALLAAGAERRATEIDVLSDMQRSGFPGALAGGGGTPPIVAWVPGDAVPPNAGVAEVTVGGGVPPRAGQRSTVEARVVGSRPDSVGMRLTVDGRTTAAAHAAAGSTAILPFPAHGAGIATGWVELDADALHGDDRRYFVADVQPPPAVALTRPLPFVDAALGVLADAGRIRRADAGAADVVIAPDAAGPPGIPTGRTLAVVAPESPLQLAGANQRLALAGAAWRFGSPVAGGELRFDARDSADDLVRALAGVRVRQVYPLQRQGVSAGDTVLLRLGDGSPWAVRGTLPSGGRYILLASPLTPEASNLPTSAAMVPLLDHLSGAWTTTAETGTDVLPGGPVRLPAGATEVQRPDGVREPARGDYRAPGTAGIYRVFAQGGPIGAFAVNPPAVESDQARLEARRFVAFLPGWDVESASSPREWSRDVFRSRLGHEVWRPLLAALLVLLLVEALAATAGPGRPRAAAAPAAAATSGDEPAGAGWRRGPAGV